MTSNTDGAPAVSPYNEPPALPQDEHAHDKEKVPSDVVDTPVPYLTWRSLTMGVFISIGGIIFGYDTGQISGILEMGDFLQRFGEVGADGSYSFSNVRSGLIVGLVCYRPVTSVARLSANSPSL